MLKPQEPWYLVHPSDAMPLLAHASNVGDLAERIANDPLILDGMRP